MKIFHLLNILCAAAVAAELKTIGCTYDAVKGEPVLVENVAYSEEFDAWVAFNDTLHEIGWGKLHVRARSHGSDRNAVYCAGYVEGVATHTRIWDAVHVVKDNVCGDVTCTDGDNVPEELRSWLQMNIDYTRAMVQDMGERDAWWRQVRNVLARFDGVLDGYNAARTGDELEISELWFWIFHAHGDLGDIEAAAMPATFLPRRTPEWMETHHHCSALVELSPDMTDVWVAQDAWSYYNTMNRMWKDYEAVLEDAAVVPTRWTFSSAAGITLSYDDLWVLNSGLTVLETTVSTWNHTLYSYCSAKTVLSWIRVQVANFLATDGPSWVSSFLRENSFTYNNQYFVLNLNLFEEGKEPPEGFLYTTEQVPGIVKSGDRTAELVTRRWVPSINVPFFEEVYNWSGYPQKVNETEDPYWSYEGGPRHMIMKRDCPNIETYEQFQKFMRYNQYQTDPLSNGDPAQAILCRYDLRPKECLQQGTMKMCPAAFGGLDAKTTRLSLMRNLAIDGISSPQYEDHEPWSFGVGDFADVVWHGLPQTWQFPWVQFSPDTF